MLRGEFEAAGELTPEALREAYDEVLVATVETVGIDRAVEQSGLERETLSALLAGQSPTLSLEEAAAILALQESRPDAASIAAEARDILLMGMTTAVLDVEALASEINDELEPKEIQQKIEGRYPMTVDEYAVIHAAIESRTR